MDQMDRKLDLRLERIEALEEGNQHARDARQEMQE